jgi:CMP-2-keto-3-deoxyoctulosonic acid synthetase
MGCGSAYPVDGGIKFLRHVGITATKLNGITSQKTAVQNLGVKCCVTPSTSKLESQIQRNDVEVVVVHATILLQFSRAKI